MSMLTISHTETWITNNEFHIKIHVHSQEFSVMASDWLAALLPANQKPSLKIFVDESLMIINCLRNHSPENT